MIKIKTDIKGIDNLSTNINKISKDVFNSKIMNMLARRAIELIYMRVKSGYGVNDDSVKIPDKKKLAPLKESYIEYRKGKIRFYTNKTTGKVFAIRPTKGKFSIPSTGEYFSPGKSNLTMTGQMLASMDHKAGTNYFTISIKGRRKDGKDNKDIAKFVSEGGGRFGTTAARPFFALSKTEQKNIIEMFKEYIVQLLNKEIS